MNRKILTSWALYDWANSALNVIVFTFVFSVYFARSIYGDEVSGSAAWSFAQGCAGVAIAVLSPLFGAAVDQYGPRKHVLKILSILCVIICAGLFFMMPNPAFILPALIIGAVLTVCFELAQSTYGMMLPIIAPKEKIGLASGIGWGAGYIGSIVCLVIALIAFIGLGDAPGLLGLEKENAVHVRSTMLLAAGWFFVFSIPLFLFCPDVAKSGLSVKQSVQNGVKGLVSTIKDAKEHSNFIRFLIASAIYRDGLVTLFAVGGLYAAGTLQMSFSDVIVFAIVINITSGIGAIVMAFFDDRWGSKTIIALSLIGLIITGACVILVDDKMMFIGLSCVLGLFIGPVQAASRTLLVHLSPPEKIGSFFGLYAMSGKAVSFLGPFAFAGMTYAFDSQRAGMVSILFFWIVGLALLRFVRENNVATE